MPSLVPFKKVAKEILQEVSGFDASHPWRDHIVGGQADGMDPNQFDINQLSAGVTEEMEHTNDPNMAAEIAMDHLAKDPDYYKKLKLIDPGDAEEAQAKIGAAKTAGIMLARQLAKEAGLLGGIGKALGAAGPAASGGAIAPALSASKALAPRGMAAGSWRVPGMASKGTLVKAPPAGAVATKGATAAGAAANGAKKMGLGRLGLMGAAGLGAYGLYKAVPSVVRMAREEGSMPMAAGGGWSPIAYGFGHTPWGNAAPNMGAF